VVAHIAVIWLPAWGWWPGHAAGRLAAFALSGRCVAGAWIASAFDVTHPYEEGLSASYCERTLSLDLCRGSEGLGWTCRASACKPARHKSSCDMRMRRGGVVNGRAQDGGSALTKRCPCRDSSV
jgi:hypothetical protein